MRLSNLALALLLVCAALVIALALPLPEPVQRTAAAPSAHQTGAG